MERDLKPPVRWLRSYSDEENIFFYFELDGDGWVLGQVELEGPTRTPIVAAALKRRGRIRRPTA